MTVSCFQNEILIHAMVQLNLMKAFTISYVLEKLKVYVGWEYNAEKKP